MASKRVLFIGDPHAPFHDKKAWKLVLKVGKYLKPDIVVHLGDHLDAYSISSYAKQFGRKVDLQWEIDVANELLDDIDSLGASVKVFKEGNHDERMARYAADHPEIGNIVVLKKMLRLSQRGWKYVPFRSSYKLGKVHITHSLGHTGRNAVLLASNRWGNSVIGGDTHRMCYLVESSAADGSPRLVATFGWLGDVKQIDYEHTTLARSAWPLGFGVGTLETKTGHLYVQPVPILPDYSCMVDGRIFR